MYYILTYLNNYAPSVQPVNICTELYICIQCIYKKKIGVFLVVRVSASHAVGHGFAPLPGQNKDHHKNGTNCLPAPWRWEGI